MASSFNLANFSILAGLIVFVGLIFLIYSSLRLLDDPRSKEDPDVE
jgi:hypothetical protein